MWNTILNASLSAIGAAIPILILMYVHFLFRKKNYNEIGIKAVQLTIDFFNHIIETSDVKLKEIYANFGVKNLVEFITKVDIDLKIKQEIGVMINDLEKDRSDAKLSLMKEKSVLDYFKNYSFTDYLSQILNIKFPDTYVEGKYKKLTGNK